MASVKVAVRVRPINKREISLGSTCIISTDGRKTSITNLKIPAHSSEGESGLGRERVKTFTYDYSYWSVNPSDPQFASQERVFQDLGEDVLKSAFEGYNACIFAYGQTGSGKSYTMMGEPSCEGLIPRICEGLYNRIKKEDEYGVSCRTEVSYLEIYCERVRDLLRPSTQYTLRVREHPRDGPYVQDLSKHLVSDYQDVKLLMEKGNIQRTTASTMMNNTSSRSHAIFTITFTQAKFHDDMPIETISKINLVDLAGSERADATGATGDRLKEGANINKSLVTLGNVISALADMSSTVNFSPLSNKRKSIVFIPYRDSVLTWLLKDSLGGNSKTIMVATISPADVNYGETLSTLRYANRAKNIINKPTINEDPNVRLIRQLRAEIARLKACLTGTEIADIPTVDKLQENEAMVKMLTHEWASKWKETQKIMKERTLALRSEGMGVVLDSDLPHLIGVDDDLLSTGLKLYHIKEGNTTIGHMDADHPCDIILSGIDVHDKHCWLSNTGGIVRLHPIEEAVCSVNGARVKEPVQLTQGCIVAIGETNLLRFNHPEEAKRLRRELKSRSLNDLSMYRSTDNLLAATLRNNTGVGVERKHREEWDKLEQKRIEIRELEERFRLAESQRQDHQKKRESDLEAQQEEIESLREQWQQAQHQATEAKQELEEERKKRHRQSQDIMRQLEKYNREKERMRQEFQLRIEELDRQRGETEERLCQMEAALNTERADFERQTSEEKQRLQELECKQEKRILDKEEELAKERVKLEDRLREEREKCQTELRKLEEREALTKEGLDKAKEDLQKKQEQVQRERDEEHHFLEIEREKLEALKAKHEVARTLAKTMDESVKNQLAMENQQVAKAWAEFDILKQRQLDAIEEAEKNIQAKAENRIAEIWESRTELDNRRVEVNKMRKEKERAINSARSEEERVGLEQDLERIAEEEKRLNEDALLLEAREADVEKDIEAEFVELEKQKRKDEDVLEAEWNNLLQIEAANLHFLEQELADRKIAIEKQKQKLFSTDNHLQRFHMTRHRTLSTLGDDVESLQDKKAKLQETLQNQECHIKEELVNLEKKREKLKTDGTYSSEEMEEQKRLLAEARASQSRVKQSEEKLKKETERLNDIVEKISQEKLGLEELLQTESFSESRFREEQRKLNEKLEIVAWSLWCVLFWCVHTFTSMALILALTRLHNAFKWIQSDPRSTNGRIFGEVRKEASKLSHRSLKHLEEQTKEKEKDLLQQKEEFERKRQSEKELIDTERAKLQELENEERISKLVEDTIRKRLLEEQSERDEHLLQDQEKERLEREQQLEQLRKNHQEEIKTHQEEIKTHQEEIEKLKRQVKKRSDSYDALSLQGNGGLTVEPRRRFLSISSAITPHTETLQDPIVTSIPKYMMRGSSFDAHYVFEIQIKVLGERWQVYRRYSKFRELHDYMKHKVPGISALRFPPKRLFPNWSERVVSKRRADLEVYLQNFISVCLKEPSCPLSPGPDRVLSRQTLCEFASFFRKGAFETTKYGTS